MSLRDEILEQPEVAARFLRRAPEVVGPLAEAIRARGVDHVVIAARGTSDHAAIYAQYVLGVRHALSVGLGTPSVISLYGAQPRLDRSLVVGISQSGASPDVVAVIEAGRRQGAPTLAITNDPASALAEAAETTIDLGAGPELAVAATKTYTTELLAIAALSAALSGDPADATALAAIPDALAAALTLEPDVQAMATEQADADRLLVIARGYEYATAREWALKLKELARVFADPYSAADFEHGPLALLEPGVPVLATIRPGPTFASRRAGRSTSIGPRGRRRGRLGRRRGARPRALALPPAGRHAGVAWPRRVDRRRAAPRAVPGAGSGDRPGGAAQPQQGDANPLTVPGRAGIRARGRLEPACVVHPTPACRRIGV